MFYYIQEAEHYAKLLEEAKAALLEMMDMDGWKLDGGKSLEEGIIYSQNMKKYGRKIFKLQVKLVIHFLYRFVNYHTVSKVYEDNMKCYGMALVNYNLPKQINHSDNAAKLAYM